MPQKKNKLPYTNNEVQTGFLVVASIATLLWLLFMAAGGMFFQKTYPVNMRFNYISGLKVNAPVHYAGHEIGKVNQIDFIGGDGPKVQVTTDIREDIRIETDSNAYINIMGFMGETYIEISAGTQKDSYLKADDIIMGTDPIPMMEIIKKATEISEEFEKLARSMNAMVEDLGAVVDKNQPEMNQIFENLEVTSDNLKMMTEDLKGHPWKLLRKPDKEYIYKQILTE